MEPFPCLRPRRRERSGAPCRTTLIEAMEARWGFWNFFLSSCSCLKCVCLLPRRRESILMWTNQLRGQYMRCVCSDRFSLISESRFLDRRLDVYGWRFCEKVQVGSGRQDVEFCSITINDGSQMTDDMLQRKLQEISRLREQLRQMEIELARTIARSEMLELQNTYEVKVKEQIDINNNLKVSNTCTLLFFYKREVCLIYLNC